MLYKKPTFTLPAVGERKAPCDHKINPWTDARGRCVQCGQKVGTVTNQLPEPERAD